MAMSLIDKAKSLPKRPGVYLFKGDKDAVIYVGKAKNLRIRVISYFLKSGDERPQVQFLIKRTRNVEFIVTDTEKEALLLENTLIKQHRPRYNFQLRDDKTYVSIRIGMEHRFPGISITRRPKRDGAEYFGPYDSSTAAREAIEYITKFIRLRSCKDTEFANRVRACLKYDIDRCTGPCAGLVSDAEYKSQVDEARMFLAGRSADLMKRLSLRMKNASSDMQYEEAARLRDAIGLLRGLRERQNVVSHKGGDHDAVGMSIEGDRVTICVMDVRGGVLVGKRAFFSTSSAWDRSKIMEEFLLQHYEDPSKIPSRIFVSVRPEAAGEISGIISDRKGAAVSISVPSRGRMRALLELSCTNASEALAHRRRSERDAGALERLGRVFGMDGPLESIECADISNTGGREAVGSVVSFRSGEPDKINYRIYNIRTLETPDDYAMMREVTSRRFADNVDRPVPDLFLVDGGRGQLSVAVRAMGDLGLSIPIAAIAKPQSKGDIERVFIPGRKNPLPLKKGSAELLFLMRVRDEAHRFGISAHRRRRGKTSLKTNPKS